MKLEYISENDNIHLSEELKLHTTRKLYKSIKSLNLKVYVNGIERKTFEFINKGDVISIDYDIEKESSWTLYESSLDIYYEDMYYIIVNKRKGLFSIPTKAEPYSIYQEVLYYLKNKNEPLTISLLNRLDKETGGLMMIAKNRIAANLMQTTHKKMERFYICKTHGIWDIKEGTIDNYINKDINSNKRYIDTIGKRAISHYKVIKEDKDISYVLFHLDTGRTHQIRLHTSYMRHPILGDKLYAIDDGIEEIALLSVKIKFHHPFMDYDIEISLKENLYE
jgi:23S rRNA pseudouridine1911/1915/1917 synthase